MRTRARSVSLSGRSTSTSIRARRNPASMRCSRVALVSLSSSRSSTTLSAPRLPQAIEKIVAARVPRDVEHRSSSTRDAVLEIDGTLLACALGRCAHRNDARGVVLPVPVEPLDAIAILQPCSELEAVALSQLRSRQHLLGAEAGFSSECHCANLVLDDSGRAGAGARGDTGAEGNLLTELERLLRVLLRRQTEFVSTDRPVDDDPGGLVVLEVFREHELELRTAAASTPSGEWPDRRRSTRGRGLRCQRSPYRARRTARRLQARRPTPRRRRTCCCRSFPSPDPQSAR